MMKTGSIFAAVVLVTTLFTYSPAAAPADQWNALLNEAAKATEKGRSRADQEKAAKKLEQALAIAAKSLGPAQEVATLHKLAGVAESLGQISRAAGYQERAASAARRIPDRDLEGISLAALGRYAQELGRHTQAAQSFQALAVLRKAMGDQRGEADARSRLAAVYRDWGKYSEAEASYRDAREIARRSKDPRAEAAALAELGAVTMHKGAYAQAAKIFKDALALSEQLQDPSIREGLLISLGHVARYTGQYASAADYFQKALELGRVTKNPQTECLLLTNLGELFTDWGQLARALELYTEALTLARDLDDGRTEAQVLIHMAALHSQRGRAKQALGCLRDARKVSERSGIPSSETDARMGELYLDLGDIRSAEPLIKKSGSDAPLGRLYLAKSEHDKATLHFQRLLKSAEQSGRMNEVFAARVGLAKVHEAQEDYGNAETSYSKAIAVTEELRSSLLPSERRSFLAVRVHGFDRSEPARGLARIRFKSGRAAESIGPSELARARAFADRLALGSGQGYAGIPRSVQEREAELTIELAGLKKARGCCPRRSDPERYDNLTRQIRKAEADLQEFVDVLWKEYTQYAAVKYPRPVLPESWATTDDEYVVIFDVLGDGVGVKLYRGKEMSYAAFVKWSTADLTDSVKAFREPFELVEFRKFDPDLGKMLYERLLAPALAHVPKGAPIIVIPDGILAELPFDALVVDGKAQWRQSPKGDYPEGLTYLWQMHQLSYYQSMTALTLQRTQARKRQGQTDILVLADPIFQSSDARACDAPAPATDQEDQSCTVGLMRAVEKETAGCLQFTRLPGTGSLAENLKGLFGSDCAVYSGVDACKSTFFTSISPTIERFAYAVFATHGVYSSAIPGIMEPFLTMTMVPEGTDGFLTMTEVMSLNMNAEGVVLAACQTALGEHLTGEGVMSMGRAFHYAGARSVLMTLWSVEETATVTAVESFFRHLKAGAGKLDAVAAARADLIERGYKHPFFWAPFILVGEAR